MIHPCTCTDEYQDRTHGRWQRVHTVGKDGQEARCTICGKTKEIKKQRAQTKESEGK
jgi:hypothetical protein